MSELCERLDVIDRLDAAIGPIKQRRRGRSAGQLLVGVAQLAGEDFWVGLGRQSADRAGRQLAPVPNLAVSAYELMCRSAYEVICR